MRLFLLLFSVLNLSISGAFAGGSSAGNGGGLSESRLAYAVQDIDRYLILCSQTSACSMSETEKAVLSEVRTQLSHASPAQKVLLTYETNGLQAPLFKSDASVGAPVVFNRDVIYFAVSPGSVEKRAMSVAEAVATIAKVLAYQAKATIDDQADIYSKIVSSLKLNTLERNMSYVSVPEISVQFLRLGGGLFSVLLSGADQAADITQSLQTALANALQTQASTQQSSCKDQDLTSTVRLQWTNQIERTGQTADKKQILTTGLRIRTASTCNICETVLSVNLVDSDMLKPGADHGNFALTLAPESVFKIESSFCGLLY